MEYGKKKDIFVGSKPLNPSNKPFYSCKFDTKTLKTASYESEKLFYCCNVGTTTNKQHYCCYVEVWTDSKLMRLTGEY